MSDCACLHCDLSSCLSVCSDYVTCLNGQPDACADPCSPNQECAACTGRINTCLMGFCVNSIACATQTTGGPCSKIEACCAMQGSRAQSCLALVQKVEKLGGDPSCTGLMQDEDFLMNIAFDPVCKFN